MKASADHGFGKDVSRVVSAGNTLHIYFTRLDRLANRVEFNVDVFAAFVPNRIVCKTLCPMVISV